MEIRNFQKPSISKTLKFKAFCFEMYKLEKGLSGLKTQEFFKKYKVFEYFDSFYDVLHTMGVNTSSMILWAKA